VSREKDFQAAHTTGMGASSSTCLLACARRGARGRGWNHAVVGTEPGRAGQGRGLQLGALVCDVPSPTCGPGARGRGAQISLGDAGRRFRSGARGADFALGRGAQISLWGAGRGAVLAGALGGARGRSGARGAGRRSAPPCAPAKPALKPAPLPPAPCYGPPPTRLSRPCPPPVPPSQVLRQTRATCRVCRPPPTSPLLAHVPVCGPSAHAITWCGRLVMLRQDPSDPSRPSAAGPRQSPATAPHGLHRARAAHLPSHAPLCEELARPRRPQVHPRGKAAGRPVGPRGAGGHHDRTRRACG
jgi:hypothetical protein